MRRRIAATTAALLTAAGLLTAPPASADAGGRYAGCPVGYVCLYRSYGLEQMVYKTPGTFRGEIRGVRSIFNNGTVGGYDHVIVEYTSSLGRRSDCVHVATPQNPGEGSMALFSASTIWKLTWVPASHSACDGPVRP